MKIKLESQLQHIRMIRYMLRTRMLLFPNLIHGLDAVLYRIAEGDFSNFSERYNKLLAEIKKLEGMTPETEPHRKWLIGITASLFVAKVQLDFWVDIFQAYFAKEMNDGNTSEYRASSRELIGKGKTLRFPRLQPVTNDKRNQKGRCKGRHVKIAKSVLLLEGNTTGSKQLKQKRRG